VIPRRLPALDGVRGLAVLSILFFHGGASWLPGGGIGVDAFFVLSGFLITGLLLDERHRIGRIRIGAFYARRALRLLPALAVLLAFLIGYSFVGGLPDEQAGELRRGVAFTAVYAANLQVAVLGELPPFSFTGHMWSLSIEEQFYLVWPLVLALLLWRRVSLRGVLIGVLVAAVGAALWRAHLWTGPADVERVYYAPDTRADALLIGCALALVAALRGLPRLPVLAGIGGLFLVLQAVLDSHLGSFGYEGGYLLTALAAAAVLAGVVGAADGLPARLLSLRPLVAVGRISYSLYLWHWPVFVILNPGRLDMDWLPLTLVRFTVAFVAATLSFVLIERPALRLGARFRPATTGRPHSTGVPADAPDPTESAAGSPTSSRTLPAVEPAP
jgi:peptidoglycan/LPS O-acetylase OafA/YrhL